MPKKTSSDPRALEIKSLTARRPSKAGTAKKAIKKNNQNGTARLDSTTLATHPTKCLAGRPAGTPDP
jgi:hypothetical protein